MREIDFGAVVVVCEGVGLSGAVEDDGEEGAVEVLYAVAVRVDDFAFDGDAREDGGTVGAVVGDGYVVDLSDDNPVFGDGETESGVAEEEEAVGDAGGVFGQSQGVAYGDARRKGVDADVGVEFFDVANGARGGDYANGGTVGE